MHSIHRDCLRKVLGLPDKLPPDFQARYENVRCPSRFLGETVCTTTVIVRPAPLDNRRKSSAHRVYVVCPSCGIEIPAGRLHQHHATKACDSNPQAKSMVDAVEAQESAFAAQLVGMRERHPDKLLLFRIGDFYEAFGRDAVIMAKAIGLTITTKHAPGSPDLAMAGFPAKSLEPHLRKLLAAGHKVAICEMEGCK